MILQRLRVVRGTTTRTLQTLSPWALSLIAAACGPNRPEPHVLSPGGAGVIAAPRANVRAFDARPVVASVVRDGDPFSGVCVAVRTRGAPDEAVAVLGTLTSLRLAKLGVLTQLTAASGGYALCTEADGDASAGAFVQHTTTALLAPVDEAEASATRTAVLKLPRPTAELAAAQCAAQSLPRPDAPITAGLLEEWRTRSIGRSSVSFAVAGPRSAVTTVLGTVERGRIWPETQRSVIPGPDAMPSVVIGNAREVPPGKLWLSVTVDTARPAAALSAADRVGHVGIARAKATEASVALESTAGVAKDHGGCAYATVALDTKDLTDVAGTLGTLATVLEDELTQGARDGSVTADPTRGVHSAQEAALIEAWWALAEDVQGKDAHARVTVIGAQAKNVTLPGVPDVDAAWKRGRKSFDKQRIEVVSKLEAGQPELWMLIASPCGTAPEAASDAGNGALAISAFRASTEHDVFVEPFIDAGALGFLVHGAARKNESSTSHAERLGDVAGRAFASFASESQLAEQVIAGRLSLSVADDDVLAFTRLAQALSPGHPSWLLPFGSVEATGRATPKSLAQVAQGLRAGPVRLAVLANAQATQATDAARAADRWLFPRDGKDGATCSVANPGDPARGVFALARRSPGPGIAYIAAPLPDQGPAGDLAARALVHWLDAEPGPLRAAARGITRELSVKLVGRRERPALVLRVVTAPESLDLAVERLRAALAQAARPEAQEAAQLDAAARSILRAANLRHRTPDARVADLFSGRRDDVAGVAAMRAMATDAFALDRQVVTVLRPQAHR